MAVSETSICNMALARIGAERINSLTENSANSNYCQAHYEQARNALLASHSWRFALARADLSEDADTPDFQWDHQYILPTDCLRVVSLYGTSASYALEGDRLLTNDDEASITYVSKVTDAAQFGALFIEVLVLQLAAKLAMAIGQDRGLWQEIQEELKLVMLHARMVNATETNTVGANDLNTWIDARLAGAS